MDQHRPGAARRAATLLGLITLLAPAGFAAEAPPPDLVTDRPDQTESALSVPRGFVQLEAGYSRTEFDGDGFSGTADAVPQTLVRIGLSERIELRVGLDGYIWEDVSASAEDDGLGDGSIGVKIGLAPGSGPVPQVALLVSSTLPLGDTGFSSDRADPGLLLLVAHDLTDRLSLGYNVGPVWGTAAEVTGERHTLSVLRWTSALGISATDRLGFFVELFGETGLSAHGSANTSGDAGLTYLLQPNLQLDAATGVGLSDAADDWFGTVGVSYRWPR